MRAFGGFNFLQHRYICASLITLCIHTLERWAAESFNDLEKKCV